MQLDPRDRPERRVGLARSESGIEHDQSAVRRQGTGDAIGAHRFAGAQHRRVGDDEQILHATEYNTPIRPDHRRTYVRHGARPSVHRDLGESAGQLLSLGL